MKEDDSITTEDIKALLADEATVHGLRRLSIDTDELLNHSLVVFRGREGIKLQDFWNSLCSTGATAP